MKSRLKAAYHDTVFEYIPNAEVPDFWVITAHNPDGKTTDAGDNVAADKRLHAEIAELGIIPFRIIERSPDDTHAEPGWGFPCGEATAMKIGRRYRQDAVFHFTDGRIALVNCKTSERHPLDAPETRKLDPRELRHFTLFVGSPPDSKRLDPLEYTGVCTRTGAMFPGFTIQRADGCFHSRFEDTLLIHVATREAHKVLSVAHDLRCFLNQTGIGISHNGIYQRVREWTDDGLILQSFGLTGQ